MLHYSLFSHRLAPVSKRNRFLLYSTTGLSHSHDNDNATRNTFSKTADNDVTNTTVTTDGATGVTMQLTSDDNPYIVQLRELTYSIFAVVCVIAY